MNILFNILFHLEMFFTFQPLCGKIEKKMKIISRKNYWTEIVTFPSSADVPRSNCDLPNLWYKYLINLSINQLLRTIIWPHVIFSLQTSPLIQIQELREETRPGNVGEQPKNLLTNLSYVPSYRTVLYDLSVKCQNFSYRTVILET